MRRALYVALVVGAFLVGCGKSQIEQAQELVKNTLTDPLSATFKDVELHSVAGKSAVCGHVNAKNQMGGYVGFRRFIVAEDAVTIMSEDNASDFAGRYLELCDYKTAVKS